MPRYSINVNYAPSPWERANQGIGQAIDLYQQRQDQQRNEANQIAAQGGVPVGDAPPTVGSRIGQVRDFLRRKVLGQPDPGASPAGPAQQGAAGPSDTPVTMQVPAAQGVTQPGGSSLLGGATPPSASPQRIGDALVYDPSTLTAGQTPPFAPAAAPTASAAPVLRTGPGTAPTPPAAGASPGASSIGNALAPYTVTAGSGQKYSIDPTRPARLDANARGLEATAIAQGQSDVKERVSQQNQQEQIQALVDAGMSPAVARAKVLNNVVKYDEQYGQQHPGVMTQKDRMAVQDRIDSRQRDSQRAALRLEGLRQQGRQGTREFQELSIQLRAQQQDDANDRAILSADEAEAGRTSRAVTTLQTNPVVSNTPEGKQAIASAQAGADAAAKKAAESRGRVAGKGSRPVPGGRPTINQAQYEAARAKINPATRQPYTDAEIGQFYTIDPSVKRK